MKKVIYFLLILSVVFITGFIFYNSSQDYVTSFQKSEEVAEIIRPSQVKDVDKANYIIRKSAHIVEFGALGMFVMLLTLMVRYDTKKSFIGFASFYMLSVAVLDEYIQSFSNRTSRTKDILIDFFGAILGFVVAAFISFVIKIYKNKKMN